MKGRTQLDVYHLPARHWCRKRKISQDLSKEEGTHRSCSPVPGEFCRVSILGAQPYKNLNLGSFYFSSVKHYGGGGGPGANFNKVLGDSDP